MSRLLALPALAMFAITVLAVPPEDPKAPPPSKGSPEESLLAIQVATDFKVTVWASEPLMKNPVAFCFDEKGRVYVAETNRLHDGVPDTRNHMAWLDEDLACRTVADRVAMYQKHKYGPFPNNDDQVRMVWDSTGKGKADKSSVFSKGYSRPEDGLGSGVLARKGGVYYTNIPSLYLLKDTKGENVADVKQELVTGFGVRVQFVGHDMHGLRMGPDGKLYFSIGDRGLNVKNKEGKEIVNTLSGAVLRCDPDGGNLELVHTGLRNPQELAFDDFGNLFTFDNNCDSGDSARWVQIVEGGDSGWRCGYQYGSGFHTPDVKQGNRGPWNTEKIWHVPGPDGGPPAYVVPPLKHFGNGPSGITHYPGVGLNDRYKDHFFACDFTSSPGNSKIWSLALKPKGASFEVVDLHPFVQGMVPTDCEFGPDGAFYWSDWVGGWGHPQKGRIFRLTDPVAMKNPAVDEAKKLLAEGFEQRTADDLAKLLEHPHQMVRFETQYELANRGLGLAKQPAPGIEKLLGAVASQSKNQYARIHAIWALGTIGRKQGPSAIGLLTLMNDPDSEIRAQTAKVLGWMPTEPGDGKNAGREMLVRAMTKENDLRVRFFATQSYGKTTKVAAIPDITKPIVINSLPESTKYLPLFDLLKANNEADAYLRHAAVVALVNISSEPDQVFSAWKFSGPDYDTPAVRLGVLLALRRLKSERCAAFLADTDPRLVVEAARAIYDERIAVAVPALARLAEKSGQPEAVAYRSLSASYVQGKQTDADWVAKFAARSSEPDHIRIFALKLLGDWAKPPKRDPVTGNAIDLDPRTRTIPASALRPVIAGVFAGSEKVRAEAASVSAKLEIKEVGPLLTGIVKDVKAPVSSRVDALAGLAYLKDSGTKDLIVFAITSDQPKLRAAGRTLLAKTEPSKVIGELPALLKDEKTSLEEKQGAFEILGSAPQSEEVDKLLGEWLDAVKAGNVQPELLLDVLDAGEVRSKAKLKLAAPLKGKVDDFRSAQDKKASGEKGDKLAPYSDSLAGGDAEKGRNIFLNNSSVYCQRCHKLDGQGGDVGPVLNGIASQPDKDRRYFLESVVLPSKTIAKGFETAVLTLADGRVVTGIVKEENKKTLKIITPENKELVIPVEDIEARRTGPSAMPDDLHKKLTRRELRDVVEFLASLKEPEKKR